MRNNQPVTQKQINIPEGSILSTTTDLNGTILTATDDFVEVSGFKREDMIGQPHNMIRHPDVPAAVFQDLWITLKKGKPWNAIVKNRASNGDHYWVEANASPIVENSQIVGYVSVRTPATSKQIEAAEKLYKDVASGKILLQEGIPKNRLQVWKEKINVINRLKVKTRVYLAVWLPLLMALILGVQSVFEQYNTKQEMERLAVLMTLTEHFGNVVHEMQKERGMTAGFLGSKGKAFANKLPKQREKVNKEIADLNRFIKAMPKEGLSSVFLQELSSQQSFLKKRQSIRRKVSDLSISVGEAIRYYTASNGNVLSMIEQTSQFVSSSHFERSLIAFSAFLQAKERAGIERAVLSATFVANAFSEGVFAKFVGLVAAQQNYMSVFLAYASDLEIQKFNHLMKHESVQKVHKMRDVAMAKADSGNFGISSADWFSAKTAEINQLRKMETFIAENLLSSANEIKLSQSVGFWMTLLFMVLALFMVLTLSYIVVGRLTSTVETMKSVMQRTEQTGMFNNRVQLTDNGDELADMARAFNSMMGQIQRTITSVNDVMASMGRGQFDLRVTDSVSGDLKIMKDGVNASADQVMRSMEELKANLKALYEGEFSREVNMDFKGEYLEMIQYSDRTMRGLHETIDDIISVMSKMKDGKFQYRVKADARGDLLILKDGVNHSLDTLENAMVDITRVVKAQSEGDLTQRITADYHGELRILKDSVNTSAVKLVEVVSKAVNASLVVKGAAQEVSQGSLDLSQRVQEQAAALEETSATMDEMNSQVQSNTNHANEATKVAEAVQAKADNGVAVMKQTIEAMGTIQESSDRISDIVTLIDGIAFQTNLLALNAAVEAARAGEHGRGFAVVAGEVRSLAQKSAEAAKDIKTLIDETVERVELGSKLATDSGEMLSAINGSIDEVAQMIAQIAQASSEQATGIHQVHNAITQIDNVTQQNAALVEETSAASESLNEQAEVLTNDMAFFDTGSTTSDSLSLSKVASTNNTEEGVVQLSAELSAQDKPTNTIPFKPKKSIPSNEWDTF